MKKVWKMILGVGDKIMDEMLVRPKYSRQTNIQRKKKRPDENDMMSTVFAVKMLAVVVFLSVFALCKAANTPATNIFISKVRDITTENFDANKYLSVAVNALGIKLPEKDSILPGTTAQATEHVSDASEAVQTTAGQINNLINDNNTINQVDNQNNIQAVQPDVKTNTEKDQTPSADESGTISSSINDTINAMNQVPILGEADIKVLADKYSFVVPIKGEIESPFGIRTDPLSGYTAFHSGIDIKANMGTSIKAALDGEVTEVGSSPEYDNYVKVKHNDGIYTVYAHCSILVAKKGQMVKQGDILAKVGDTEGLSGAYLHFEVWKNDKAVDPEKLLNLLNN